MGVQYDAVYVQNEANAVRLWQANGGTRSLL